MALLRTYYPGGFNYHKSADAVVILFKNKLITEKKAISMLKTIENKAYKLDRYAEPDGDITFAVATSLSEIK